jgi:hypothetical protein
MRATAPADYFFTLAKIDWHTSMILGIPFPSILPEFTIFTKLWIRNNHFKLKIPNITSL